MKETPFKGVYLKYSYSTSNTPIRSQMTTARFSTDGQYIFGGTAQGRVIVFELPSLNVSTLQTYILAYNLQVVSESGMCNGAIKQISISNSDRCGFFTF